MRLLLRTFALIGALYLAPPAKANEEQLELRVANLEGQVANLKDEIDKLRARVSPDDDRASRDEIVIDIDASGQTRIDGEEIGEKDLQSALTGVGELKKNQALRVSGDSGTKFEHIIRVIKICQKAGLWNISFEAKPE